MNVHEKRNAILGVEFDCYVQMLVIHTGGARGGLAGQFCVSRAKANQSPHAQEASRTIGGLTEWRAERLSERSLATETTLPLAAWS